MLIARRPSPRIATSAGLPSAVRASGLSCVAAMEMMQGHLVTALARMRARQTSAARGGDRDNASAQMDSALVDAWFLDRRERAITRLDAMLAKTPWQSSLPSGNGPQFGLIYIYALAGAADRARSLLAEYDSLTKGDTAQRRIHFAEWHRARAQIAVAEKRYDDGLREFAASDTSYDRFPIACGSCTMIELARTHDLAGHADAAIAAFEQYLAYHAIERYRDNDRLYLAGVHKRLGELYEAKGNREKAMSNYSSFLTLWKSADPELQPKVEAVRRRMQALSAGVRR